MLVDDLTMISGATITSVAGIYEKSAALVDTVIDLNSGSVFTKTITGVTAFSVISVPPAGNVATFILELTNGGAYAVSYMVGTKWAGGTPPTLTATGKDILAFYTIDSGSTWNGLVLGKDVKDTV